jgi:hypothetical protein
LRWWAAQALQWVWVVAGLLGLGGCGPGLHDARPDSSVSRDEMKALMKEIYILEQGLSTLSPQPQVRDSLARVYYLQTLQRHNLTPEEFLTAYEAYQKAPKYFREMHEEMLLELAQLSDSVKRQQPPLPPPDSTRNLSPIDASRVPPLLLPRTP